MASFFHMETSKLMVFVENMHDPCGKEFGQKNTVWVLEVGISCCRLTPTTTF